MGSNTSKPPSTGPKPTTETALEKLRTLESTTTLARDQYEVLRKRHRCTSEAQLLREVESVFTKIDRFVRCGTDMYFKYNENTEVYEGQKLELLMEEANQLTERLEEVMKNLKVAAGPSYTLSNEVVL